MEEWIFEFVWASVWIETHLRHPDIGFLFKSCIVSPHKPIEASIHATNNKLVIMSSLHGTTNTVKIAVWKWERKKKHANYLLIFFYLFNIKNAYDISIEEEKMHGISNI